MTPEVEVVVRVLVAIEPKMYREVLAFHLRQQRPQSEVVLASPENLEATAERTRPHLTIANEVPPMLKEMGFWVEVPTDGWLDTHISADGYSATLHDVSLEDLVAVVDKAEEELAYYEEH
jgi:hypothetical protein